EWLQRPAGRRGDSVGSRLSLREIHGAFHARRWWRYETRLRARLLARGIAEGLAADPEASVEQLCAGVPPRLAGRALEELGSLARGDRDPLHAARLWRA